MPSCFVYGCKTDGKAGSHLFRLPNCLGKKYPDPSLKKAWITKLKKVRSDVTFDPTNKNHRVCSLHFQESDIVKEDRTTIKGEIVALPRLRWKLIESAIPTVFDCIPSHMLKISPKKRRDPEERRQEMKKRRIPQMHSRDPFPAIMNPDAQEANEGIPNSSAQEPNRVRFQDIQSNFQGDTNWELRMHHHNGSSTLSFLQFELRDSLYISKEVQVSFTNSNKFIICLKYNLSPLTLTICTFKQVNPSLEYRIFFEHQEMLSVFNGDGQTTITSLEHLREILNSVRNYRVCKGVVGFRNITACRGGVRSSKGWISATCEKVGTHVVCVPCKLLSQRLSSKSYRMASKSTTPKPVLQSSCPIVERKVIGTTNQSISL